jgi:hypothetical protein
VVCDTCLLDLQIYAGRFETSQQGEMVDSSSQGRHLLGVGSAQWGVGRLPIGFQYAVGLVPFEALSSAFPGVFRLAKGTSRYLKGIYWSMCVTA